MSIIEDQINYLTLMLTNSVFECNEQIINLFRLYLIELLKWNKKINLISKNDETQVVSRHFLESIAMLEMFPFPEKCSVIDIGSGAGFPGLPIKIMRPDLNVTLLDSKRYRVLFLQEIVSVLNLTDIKVVKERAESACDHIDFNQKYDFVIARAVTQLDKLYLWTHRFLKPGGSILTFKGGQFEKEIDRTKKMNVEVLCFSLNTPLVESDRGVSLIQLTGKNRLNNKLQ